MMLIALDYDKTYTLDPIFWDCVVASAISAGHRVVCVTMRHPFESITMPCPVIYTRRKAKHPHMRDLGINVDVWIDDSPHWIMQDSG